MEVHARLCHGQYQQWSTAAGASACGLEEPALQAKYFASEGSKLVQWLRFVLVHAPKPQASGRIRAPA